jgi:hypothetical protein
VRDPRFAAKDIGDPPVRCSAETGFVEGGQAPREELLYGFVHWASPDLPLAGGRPV